MQREVQVRAYDLGGFGDIAGALRVASHLKKHGFDVGINPSSGSALSKLHILVPDVPISSGKAQIHVDVAGHYRNGRLNPNSRVPHIYSEDMDHLGDRSRIVPIYIKSGLRKVRQQVPFELRGVNLNPMFYRPLREWELPKPRERDVRSMIAESMFPRNHSLNAQKRIKLEKILESADRIGFAHINPEVTAFFTHPFMEALDEASRNYEGRFVLGLFFGENLEKKIANDAYARGYNVVTRQGGYLAGDSRKPVLLFLGPQSQMTTTSLFLSSTMPNLVTGDLSLSDGLYSLVAMGGQGFFYDSPIWKVPTQMELIRIFGDYSEELGQTFSAGSHGGKHASQIGRPLAASVLGNPKLAEDYRRNMRQAVVDEITKRFGPMAFEQTDSGLYVPRGAPFLFQDTTENVVRALSENPELLREVDGKRRDIMVRGPIFVATSVMEPLPSFDWFQEGIENNKNYLSSHDSHLKFDSKLEEKKFINYFNSSYLINEKINENIETKIKVVYGLPKYNGFNKYYNNLESSLTFLKYSTMFK